jgi:hypothetical protein
MWSSVILWHVLWIIYWIHTSSVLCWGLSRYHRHMHGRVTLIISLQYHLFTELSRLRKTLNSSKRQSFSRNNNLKGFLLVAAYFPRHFNSYHWWHYCYHRLNTKDCYPHPSLSTKTLTGMKATCCSDISQHLFRSNNRTARTSTTTPTGVSAVVTRVVTSSDNLVVTHNLCIRNLRAKRPYFLCSFVLKLQTKNHVVLLCLRSFV